MDEAELQEKHDRLFQRAVAMLKGELILHGSVLPRLSWFGRRRIRRAQAVLAEVLDLNPTNWSAIWLNGKAHQRLGDDQSALDDFAKAHMLNPAQPDVAREATISAIRCTRPTLAVQFATSASQAKPSDAGLRSNLALAHLFDQNPKGAKVAVDQALALDPADQVTCKLAQLIDEVLTGRRPCPATPRDLGMS